MRRKRVAASRLLSLVMPLLFLGGSSLHALDPDKGVDDYVIKSWTEEQGLPHRLLWSLCQSRDGYIWIGSGDGLVRFDGVRFETFGAKDVAAFGTEPSIRPVVQAPDGALWVGPSRSDLVVYEKGHFAKQEGLIPEVWRNAGVRSMLVDSKGVLWLTNHGGIASISPDRKFNSIVPPSSFSGTSRRVIVEDKQGRIWYTGLDGVYMVEGGQVGRPITVDSPRGLCFDREGTLWVGADHRGLLRFRDGQLTPVALAAEISTESLEVNDIRFDRHGNLWVATNLGLCRLRRDGSAPTSIPALSNVSVQELLEDANGTLWCATRSGLFQIKDPAFRTFAAGTGMQDVLSLIQDREGTIWFVTVESPYVHQVSRGRYVAFKGSLPPGVTCLHQDRSGAFWLGTAKGLFKQQGQQWVRNPSGPATAISVIAEDPSGQLWVGDLSGGVYRLDEGGRTSLSEAATGGKSVEWLFRSRDGTLWIATREGVYQLKDGKTIETRIGDRAVGHARHVAEDAEGAVWIGSRSGLVRVKDGRAYAFSVKEGLPDPIIDAILDDQIGNLWVGCSKGVFRVAKKDFEELVAGKASELRAVLFSRRDGIRAGQASHGAGLRARDGSLWFGTTSGVATIPYTRLAVSSTPPPVYVTSALVDETTCGADEAICIVPAGKRRMTFDFTAIDFDAPERLRFRYRLDGFDTDWQQSDGERVATYTGMRPGRYTFRVQATNASGVWSDKDALKALRLRAYVWEWYSFYVFLGLVVAGALYAGYRFRVNEHKARQNELTQTVDERTADLKREIADRRKAEEEAGHERDLLHALMDNIPDLIYFKDREGRYLRINKAHAETLGLATPAEATSKTDVDFFPAELAQATRAEEQRLMETGRALLGQVEHEPRSGRWYLATKVPLRDRNGEVSGLVGISKDITERKLAEEKLERDLEAFLGVVSVIANGDLTARGTPGEDTLGRIAQSINKMLERFAAILVEVRDAAFSVSTSSSEILAAATQIAKGAQFGSDGVHTTSSAVEEMAASMAQVSRNAEQSAEVAKQVLDHIHQSDQSVNATVLGMSRIDTAVTETAQKMRLLEQRSEDIFAIIALIEEIATQSNLLSLNAAIEAAHAGEAGRGFSVVAEEIRRLADRSTEATGNVNTIVKGIVGETRAVLGAMENAMREVKAGWGLSEQAQSSLQEIQTLVQRSSSFSEQISQASREQVKATQTVAQTMQTISNVTLESSAGATQTSRAVKDLVELSNQLNRAISRFKIDKPEGEG